MNLLTVIVFNFHHYGFILQKYKSSGYGFTQNNKHSVRPHDYAVKAWNIWKRVRTSNHFLSNQKYSTYQMLVFYAFV